jgi:hypothetical protein
MLRDDERIMKNLMSWLAACHQRRRASDAISSSTDVSVFALLTGGYLLVTIPSC